MPEKPKGRTVADLMPAFIKSREDRNLRPTTMMNYGIWSRWMTSHWGTRLIAKVRGAEIEDFAKSKSRCHAERTQVFFRWLVSVRVLRRSFDTGQLPLAALSDERAICYLTTRDARAFLDAVRPAYRAAFVLALFAGLRPYECCRIHWSAIHLADRRIKIDARVSKIRVARILEGLPPIIWRLLRDWGGKREGRVIPADSEAHAIYHWMYERNRAGKAAGVTMGHDILRHTFATHYVALTNNLGTAAKILGHYKLRTLTAHYDGVCPRAEGRAYFKDWPRSRKKS